MLRRAKGIPPVFFPLLFLTGTERNKPHKRTTDMSAVCLRDNADAERRLAKLFFWHFSQKSLGQFAPLCQSAFTSNPMLRCPRVVIRAKAFTLCYFRLPRTLYHKIRGCQPFGCKNRYSRNFRKGILVATIICYLLLIQ